MLQLGFHPDVLVPIDTLLFVIASAADTVVDEE
mgnify:CR=1 FL=1